ncbi:MAG: alpha/beta hydrolase [Myxococcales bacterium]|nr:alpha/beta hydrolase [Myxococcales bacterium]
MAPAPLPYRDARSIALRSSVGTAEVVSTRIEGPGPERFLLLHGNPGSMLDLAPLFEPLAALGEVVAYDAPGFGRSPPPAAQIEISAEQAVSMLDHLGWSDAVLVGHSHGGGVAQRVARRFPGRVRALVLLGTLGAPTQLSYRLLPLPGVQAVLTAAGRLLPTLPRPIGRRLVRFFMDPNYLPSRATDEEVEDELELLRAQPHVLPHMAQLTEGSPCLLLERDAPEIEAPTLFLHGEHDSIVPPRFAERIHERMRAAGRRSRFVRIERGGHMLAARDPGRCVEAIRELLRDAER